MAKKQKEEIVSKLKNINELAVQYNISPENITVKTVLEKIQETLEYYIKILTQILQPEEFFSLQECAAFTELDKESVFDMYKDLMILHREILKSEIGNDEKEMIATINYADSEIIRYRPRMIGIVQKMQDSWKSTKTKGKIGYFG